MRTMKRVGVIIIAIAITVAFMPFVNEAGFAQAASKPAKVKFIVKKCTITNQMVDLKWKKAKGAKKYQVYMKIGKGKWKKKKTVKAKTRTLKINGLKWNKTYYFKVRAVKGKKKGKFSKIMRAKVGSKKTLAYYMTNADCQEIAQQTIDASLDNNTGIYIFTNCRVKVESNLMTIELYCNPALDSNITKEIIAATYATKAMKKDMSDEINALQNKLGIVGIKYACKFYKSDGTYIYGITYEKL